MRKGRSGLVSCLALAAMLPIGCRKPARPAGYRVMGYDAAGQQWTLRYEGGTGGNDERRRLTLVCSFFRWGSHEAVKGPDACHLQVGRFIVNNLAMPPASPADYVLVTELPSETLDITEGRGDDQTRQQFVIVRHELLPAGTGN